MCKEDEILTVTFQRYRILGAFHQVLLRKGTDMAVMGEKYTRVYRLTLRGISAVKVALPIWFPADFFRG
jgi:hypothetical protein